MFYKIAITLLLFITFQLSVVVAQEKKQDTIPGTKGKVDIAPQTKTERIEARKIYSLSQFGKESYLFIRQPLRWKSKDWLNVGILAGGTALLTLADDEMRNRTQGDQKYYNSVPVEGGRIYGEWYSIAGVAASFEVYGLITGDTLAKKITIELLQAGLYAGFVATLLKISVGRARPYMNEGSGSFHPFAGINADYNSFPSGHSTSAFALSTVMSRHARPTWLKIAAYLPAGFTLFSRIYQDKHWVSDELVGAGLGYFIGNWVVDLHEERRHRINVTSIYPPAISFALD